MRLAAPQVEEIDRGAPAVHVLRGPRQAGKSTDLKLLVRRALDEGAEPRQIVYLSLDLLEDQPPSALVESLNRALELAGGHEGTRLMRSLGSKLSWSRMAREMAVPLGRPRRRAGDRNDPRTVQGYVELLAVNYFALVLYFWKRDSGTGDVAKDKKVYFGHPLLGTITAVEVADWGILDRRKATAPARALPGRPSLVASRDELDFGKSANVVPAALLLWALSG